MPVESPVTTIYDLNPAYPLGSDPKSELDNHHRLTKAALQATFEGATTNSGYQKAGRIILQWGVGSTTAGTGTVTYPIPFPNGTLQQFASLATTNINAQVFVNPSTATTTQLTVLACDTSGNGASISFRWLAIGF